MTDRPTQAHRVYRRAMTRSSNDDIDRLLRAERESFETKALRTPIAAQAPDRDIARRIRQFTLAFPRTTIARYYAAERGAAELSALSCFVFRAGQSIEVPLDHEAVDGIAKALAEHDNPYCDDREVCPPSPVLASRLYCELIEPVLTKSSELAGAQSNAEANGREEESLILIPSGILFALPLHAAWVPGADGGRPLAAERLVAFSFSATALITRGRLMNANVRVEENDDLCVLACPGEEDEGHDHLFPGAEAGGIDWQQGRFHVAAPEWAFDQINESVRSRLSVAPTLADYPQWFRPALPVRLGPGTIEGLEEIREKGPKFFLFAGHADVSPNERAVGPYLMLEQHDGQPQVATQFQLANQRWLEANKLSILAACVTGCEVTAPGGEIAGLLRAFAAAGCSALAVSLWQIDSEWTKVFVERLFRGLLRTDTADPDLAPGTVRLTRLFRDITRDVGERCCEHVADRNSEAGKAAQIEACVFALYL